MMNWIIFLTQMDFLRIQLKIKKNYATIPLSHPIIHLKQNP